MARMSVTEALNRLPHKSYDKAQLVLAAGMRGQGKTTLLRGFIETREPRVFALDPFNDFVGIRARLSWEDALDDLEDGTPCRRRVIPPINTGTRRYAEEFFQAALERLRNCLVLLDEATLWSAPQASETLQALILQGRRMGLRMAVGCQRIALVPGIMLSECTQMALFRMRRPRDIETVAEWTDHTVASDCRTLNVGQCQYIGTAE